MSESNTSQIMERVSSVFDSKRELVKFFLSNAALKHGVPYNPEGEAVVQERRIDIKSTTEQSQKTIEQEPVAVGLVIDDPIVAVPVGQETVVDGPIIKDTNMGIGSKLKSAVVKYAIPILISGTLGAGGMAVYNSLFGIIESEEVAPQEFEPQPRDGSLFQYLEDGGFHQPND